MVLALVVAVVVGRVDGGVWTDAPSEARLDQKVELAVVVVDKGRVLVPDGVDAVKLNGRRIATKQLAHLDAKTIQWSTVEPHGFRSTTATNGATSDFYSNVSTETNTFG